ncbi:MAG: DUF3365 domain-containing protein [Bacteroidetes bacterium]|jgi:hypothetical protein|nr:DUF3365 domain-containing protein [Bacteroidota bacterium]
MRKVLIFGIISIVVLSCQTNNKTLTVSEQQDYLSKGDSIATQAQQVLMKNVSTAIQEKGVAGAVDFCNINAMPLTDSLSTLNAVNIQRISEKNRNPNNAIVSELDKSALEQIKIMLKDTSISTKHLIVQESGNVYYYKAIPLGMPTCISCHGNTTTDITPETLKVIQTKYPTDKATGYQLGELRGLWKIKMNS